MREHSLTLFRKLATHQAGPDCDESVGRLPDEGIGERPLSCCECLENYGGLLAGDGVACMAKAPPGCPTFDAVPKAHRGIPAQLDKVT